MYGTLRGALAARRVDYDPDRYRATVEGVIVGEGKTIRITRIRVHYHLTIPASQRAEAERALAVHPGGCPAHESVKNAIPVEWDAEIEEY